MSTHALVDKPMRPQFPMNDDDLERVAAVLDRTELNESHPAHLRIDRISIERRAFLANGASPRIVREASFLQKPCRKDSPGVLPVLAAAFLAIASITGCKTPTHAEAKIQAEQRWGQVRGQVKVQLARQQFKRGHFEDVIRTLDEAIALDPKSGEAYALLAKANLELGKPRAASQILAIAEKVGCSSAPLHYLRGVVLEQRDDFTGALAEYEKACALDSTESLYLQARVETLVELDRATEALSLIDANVDGLDDSAGLTLLGARIALLHGDIDGALKRFQNPSFRSADSQLATEEFGNLLATRGRHREAIRLLSSRCNDEEPCRLSETGQRTLAECHLATGHPELAMMVLAQPPISEATDPPTKKLIAKAALASQQYLLALEAIEAARRRHNDTELELLLATTHWKRRDLPGAQEVLNRILQQNPSDVEAWCLLGETHLELGRPDEANAAWERALELDPGSRWAMVRKQGLEGSNGEPARP